jgi:pSer/pThr/pTyr-binding forkhead associated (FHA) protein
LRPETEMIICECGTENLNGSRYCDKCGAALWLAGKSGGLSLPGAKSNGSDGSGNQNAPATVAQSAGKPNSPVISEQQTSTPLVESGNKVHATLVIERGSSAGKQFPINSQDANIGRWDADGGVFPDVDLDSDDPEAKVSRRHARISLREGQYVIEDLGSTNGTFVNRGHRLAPGERQPLKDGDEIIVGKTFLRFRIVR